MKGTNLAIIPARMAATRFPDKPLKKILGIPMIGHIITRVQMSDCFDEVYVATCDQEIYNYALKLNCKAVMTSNEHTNCIDRSGEALEKVEKKLGKKFDNVGMIQGDEPFVVPSIFTQAINYLSESPEVSIVNIMTPIDSEEEFKNPDVVKVVTNKKDVALYMSREAIPTIVKGRKSDWKKQTGLIFFRRDSLLEFIAAERTELEMSECVDMNRMLENGVVVQMLKTDLPCLSVDTPEDLLRVEKIMKNDSTFNEYKNRDL